ncbi:hypothetical protein FRB94_009379 [Tulasnella sp. JGI-2019a]|nr:hypothetical protein FRB93_008742 [Tulasnella sp. JGI-2019a]KAG8995139.1 hypothetical protein FRB94_009379 [Tulasnella sp. JGI-2019a]KAG9026245.1 hypothetical protein FRB95_009063 [Tulasnella sp. JGI-2019a]
MALKSTRRIIYGAIIHPLSLREYQASNEALIAIDDKGIIQWLEVGVDNHRVQDVVAAKGWSLDDVDFVELKPGQWIMPGFVDTHTHAPQYPNLGAGQEYELLDWLTNLTFPTEAKFADLEYALSTYTAVVQTVINHGTTTCCYYGTLHLEATKILADVTYKKGQRAFVGKCNMDRNSAETYQEKSPEDSLRDTRTLVDYIKSLQSESPLVHPILTPRFAISCSAALLAGLGEIAARDPELAIQTHISENAAEIAFTQKLFPDCPHYAGVYDTFGLLRKKTILAHGVHLGEDELELIKAKGAGISHCPTSNFNIRSGMANVGDMLDKGIKVGLGTDVSGGYSASMLTAVQHASICSKMVSLKSSPTSPSPDTGFTAKQLPIPTLLYLATLGGADLCGLKDTVGNFSPGKEFDAILVDMRGFNVDKCIPPLEQSLEKFLFCGDNRNISLVWVRNSVVGGSEYRTGNTL